MNKWFKYSISAIVFAFIATFAMSDATFAQATTDDGTAVTEDGRRGRGRANNAGRQLRLTQEEKQALAADALGMSVEEMEAAKEALQAAMQAAKIAKIQDAVAAGELTQEEADAMIERIENRGEGDGERSRGQGRGQGRRGGSRGAGVDLRLTQEEKDALKSEAYGLSIEELDTAMEAAKAAMQAAQIEKVQAVVAAGELTQEEADAIIERMESRGERDGGDAGRGERGRRGGRR